MLNVNCMVKKTEDECTPLFEAAYWGHSEVVSILLENGADPNIKSAFCISDENPGGQTQTPLQRAAAKGIIGMVQNLIDKGAEVDVADEFGETSLHKAAGKGMKDMAQMLIDRGANVDMVDALGETPLHKAAKYGMIDVVQVLIDSGANLNKGNMSGRTPMWVAGVRNYQLDESNQVVQLLKEKGALLPFVCSTWWKENYNQ